MNVSVQFIILVPVVVGIVQAIKAVGLKSKYAPLVSIVLGLLGSILLVGGLDKVSALEGIIAGLSACGLWSGAKATFWG